ncbi:MAG: energy-coupling factor transporter ATPase [Mycoplasmataceae bacterium]|nr:energy-coupling factor transporter ATPase [Mycoplasmataceae bacterium]
MIKIDKLKFQYSGSDFFAIDDVTVEIPKGKYVAILGHNGSGKSTLSKLLVGLYKPTSGSITIDKTRITKKTLKTIRKKIGIVFQNPDNQFIGASVEDDIAFGLENKQLTRPVMQKLVKEYADKVGMTKHLHKEPQSLSGGQKQRVAIASTLALDPSIMIFDEVTSMLDPKGKREVLEIIKGIQKQKDKTLISITHDMDEAIMADLILVFAKGKLVASGSPQKILADKKIVDIAKIDAPFIYKVSEALSKKGIKPTYDKKKLIGDICK